MRDNKKTERDKKSVSSSTKIVILAVDEARELLGLSSRDKVSWFQCFCRALREASIMLEKIGSDVRVFGVVVDTNSTISNFSVVGSIVAFSSVCANRRDGYTGHKFTTTHRGRRETFGILQASFV